MIRERCKAFAAAHRSDEDRQAHIYDSRHASFVIAKVKAVVWQATCLSLFLLNLTLSLCILSLVLLLVILSHLPLPLASQPKPLRSRAIGHLSELRRTTCSEESHSSFCSPLSPAEFLAAVSNLSSYTATSPDQFTYPMLKHLSRSSMDFLPHIFNRPWSLHFFPSI